MIEALVFDLDDTLYPECDFVASGFAAVARHLERLYGCPREAVLPHMMHTLTVHGRAAVLPDVMERFLGTKALLEELVEVYRGHRPEIRLMPGYEDLLRKLGEEYRLGIITDGLPSVQRRKVEALALSRLVDAVIYTWDDHPAMEKPDPSSFRRILAILRTRAANAVVIGDNPAKDSLGARNAGMRFIPVRPLSGRQSAVQHGTGDDVGMESLIELPRILDSMAEAIP